VQESGNIHTTPSQQLSESSSRLKPTNPLAVPFRALELLDNGFSRWLRWYGSLRDRVLGVQHQSRLTPGSPFA